MTLSGSGLGSAPGGEDSAGARVARYSCPALANALNGLTGAEFQVVLPEGAEIAKPEEPLVWRQPFSLTDGAVLWLVAGKDLWEAAGRMVLGGAGIESVTEQDCRSTWHEIVAQTMGGMAQAMSAELGREVVAQGGAQDDQGPGSQTQDARFEVREGLRIWYVRIAWTSAFATACSGAGGQAEAQASSVVRETVTSKTLELLLDVALPVSVSFGKTSLQIREVLKLNTGSVVELDRLVSEPVEVIVNNCVIARGEVVVVDGNYGVRVTQLASREDRLRSGVTEASSRLGAAGR